MARNKSNKFHSEQDATNFEHYLIATKRISAWVFFLLIIVLIQANDWWISAPFLSHLFTKMPILASVVFLLFLYYLPNRFVHLPNIGDVSLLLFLVAFLIIVDKSTVIFGHSDKKHMYSNVYYWVLALVITFALLYKIILSKKVLKRESNQKTISIYLMQNAPIAIISIYISSYLLIDIRHPYLADGLNLSIVLHSIFQSQLGKYVFFDLYSQYGGYSLILWPITRIFGTSITTVGYIFFAINVIVLACYWIIIKKFVNNNFLRYIVFFATVYFQYYAISLWPGQKYFQVWPLRLLFPALAGAIIAKQVKDLKLFKIIMFGCLSSISLIWNVETGLVVSAAFISYLMLRKNFPGNLLNIFQYLLTTLLTFLSFIYSLGFLIGKNFSWEIYTRGLRLYDGVQWVNLGKTWTIFFFLYGIAILFSIRNSKDNDITASKKSAMVFIGFIGIGLLQYHLRGGNDATLGAVSWPVPILLGYFVESLSTQSKLDFVFRSNVQLLVRVCRATVVFIFVLVLSFSASGLYFIQEETNVSTTIRTWELNNSSEFKLYLSSDNLKDTFFVTTRMQNEGYRSPWDLRCEIARNIRKQTQFNKILVLSSWDALIYNCLKQASPVSWADWWHAFLKFEFDEAIMKINANQIDAVIIDSVFLRVHDPNYDTELINLIEEKFVLKTAYNAGNVAENGIWMNSKLYLYGNKV